MPTFEELIETLADGEASSYSQQRAVRELGKLKDERIVEPLISALKAEDRYVRREAAKILGELGFPAAVEPLIEALGDSEEYVRRNAIAALGALGDERAVEPLKQLLEDKSYSTRSAAEKSLRAVEEQNSGPEPVEEPAVEPEPVPPPPVPPPPVEPEVTEEVPPPTTVETHTSAEEAERAEQIAREMDERHDRKEMDRASSAKPRRVISPEIAAVIAAPPVAEKTAEDPPPTTAETHTREETQEQPLEQYAEPPKKVVLYDRKGKDKASPDKPRVIIFVVIAAILVLRVLFRTMPIFILPMLLAFGLFGVLRFLKKGQDE